MAARVTRTIASFGCSIEGRSFSSTRMRYGPRYVIARTNAPKGRRVNDPRATRPASGQTQRATLTGHLGALAGSVPDVGRGGRRGQAGRQPRLDATGEVGRVGQAQRAQARRGQAG